MPVPTPPYIDIPKGIVHGDIMEGESFSWYNSNTTGSCTVGGYSEWCSMPSNNIGPDMSQEATALLVTGSFGYSSPCLNAPSPIIVVHPVHEGHKKTA